MSTSRFSAARALSLLLCLVAGAALSSGCSHFDRTRASALSNAKTKPAAKAGTKLAPPVYGQAK